MSRGPPHKGLTSLNEEKEVKKDALLFDQEKRQSPLFFDEEESSS